MKNIFLFLGLFFCLHIGLAQAPQGINYQAIARDANGNPQLGNIGSVGFKIQDAVGTVWYSEVHSNVPTNNYGLFNLTIGAGQPQQGTFAGIPWASGPKYLQVSINGTAGAAQQMQSVPYALYAASSSPAALDIAIFEEQKGAGNDVQGTVGTYTKRLLNVETLSSPSVQLTANNEINFLQPGTYLITASAYAYQKGSHKLVLRKVGGNQEILLEGTTEFTSTVAETTNRSFIMGKLVVPSSGFKCILDHYSASPNQGTFGNGINAPGSSHETYAQIMIQKIQ